MPNEEQTITEQCEELYNKLNVFITNIINRDVTPKISNLNTEVWGSDTQTGNSRIDTLNTNFNNLNSSITTMESDINNVESDVSNLQTSVNSLDTSITDLTTTETISITPANVSGANPIYFTLIGDKFVKVSWIDNSVTCSSSNVETPITVGTLPEKYRPTSQIWFAQAFSLHIDRGRQTSLAIMTNGQVQLYCWWTGSNQATPCVFTGVYALF